MSAVGLPEIFVIAEGSDQLAVRFKEHASSKGRSVACLTYREASLRFSVRRTGRLVNVDPEIPIFLRLPYAPNFGADGETLFHFAEITSLVWAAAALNHAPVINRPNSFGLSSRSALSTNIVRWRSGLGLDGPESFSSRVPQPRAPVDEWWLERQEDGVIIPWSESSSDQGPYRAGHVRPGFVPIAVPVVGSIALGPDLPDASEDVCSESIHICNALDITFASVIWRYYPQEGTAEFARLNPHPALSEIGEAWGDIANRLLFELLS